MNCKQWDMARVVPGGEFLDGSPDIMTDRFVTCRRYVFDAGDDCWETDVIAPSGGFVIVADSLLRPIRPQPDSAVDEMLRIVGMPEREKVLA